MRSVRFDVGPSFASAVLASIHAIAALMANRFIEVLLACNFRSSFSANFQLEPAFSVPRKERSKVVAKRREYFEAGPQFQQFVREQFQSFAGEINKWLEISDCRNKQTNAIADCFGRFCL
jgi:hypothetical protein